MLLTRCAFYKQILVYLAQLAHMLQVVIVIHVMLDSFVRKEPQTLNLRVYQQKVATLAPQVTIVLKVVQKVFHAQ